MSLFCPFVNLGLDLHRESTITLVRRELHCAARAREVGEYGWNLRETLPHPAKKNRARPTKKYKPVLLSN